MLDTYPLSFVNAVVTLSEAKWLCAPFQNDTGDSFRLRFEAMSKVLEHGILQLRQCCILADIDNIEPEIERLEQLVWPKNLNVSPVSPGAFGQAINHLISRTKDELAGKSFFFIEDSDVQFFQATRPFGDKVYEKFVGSFEDIAEASKCLALRRPTACVFHLMRALEVAVQRFGRRLGIKGDVSRLTWGQITSQLNEALKKLPDATNRQKSKKATYAEVLALLNAVRIAWRNEVMHPNRHYNRQEAFEIYNASKAFMIALADIV